MVARLSTEWLAEPAQSAIRRIASAQLEHVQACHRRFEDGDEAGLHDVRVAMRQLRSWLRAFRPEVEDTVRGKTRRRLKALAAATNDARDAEVMLAWLAAQTDLPARARAGHRLIVDSVEAERSAAMRNARHTLERDLPPLARELAAQLEFYWERRVVGEAAASPRMATVVAAALQHQASRVATALGRVGASAHDAHGHRARISAKRLRYLLEPLHDVPDAADALSRLRQFQRRLGDVRDVHRCSLRLVREIGERAAADARTGALADMHIGEARKHRRSFAGARTGLVELGRRASAAERAAHDELREHSGKREIAALVDAVQAIADRLG